MICHALAGMVFSIFIVYDVLLEKYRSTVRRARNVMNGEQAM
jgi:hypothetical protein